MRKPVFITLAVVFALALFGCDDGTKEEVIPSYYGTVAGFGSWLAAQPANIPGKPYYVKLDITDTSDFTTIKTILTNNATKYVYLDLSDSTVTTIPTYALSPGGNNLIGITIPSTVTSIGFYAFCVSMVNLTSVTFQGSIPSSGFNNQAFLGNLYTVFYKYNSNYGSPGTYTTTAPVREISTWSSLY